MADNLFSMRDEKKHANRRRRVAQLYTMSTMKNYEEAVDEVNMLFLSRMEELAGRGQVFSLPRWLQYYAFDVIGKITVRPLSPTNLQCPVSDVTIQRSTKPSACYSMAAIRRAY